MNVNYESVIIHDLKEAALRQILPVGEADLVIDSNATAANCMGCFGCWLKTPGECVIKDIYRYLGAAMAQAKEIKVVSQNVYGGFSPGVKRVFDRGISASLPFFTYRKWQIHHCLRYKNRPAFTVYFYGEASAFEKQIAAELVAANSVNMGWQNPKLFFAQQAAQLPEVWR